MSTNIMVFAGFRNQNLVAKSSIQQNIDLFFLFCFTSWMFVQVEQVFLVDHILLCPSERASTASPRCSVQLVSREQPDGARTSNWTEYTFNDLGCRLSKPNKSLVDHILLCLSEGTSTAPPPPATSLAITATKSTSQKNNWF